MPLKHSISLVVAERPATLDTQASTGPEIVALASSENWNDAVQDFNAQIEDRFGNNVGRLEGVINDSVPSLAYFERQMQVMVQNVVRNLHRPASIGYFVQPEKAPVHKLIVSADVK